MFRFAIVICKLLCRLDWPHAHVLSFNALAEREVFCVSDSDNCTQMTRKVSLTRIEL